MSRVRVTFGDDHDTPEIPHCVTNELSITSHTHASSSIPTQTIADVPMLRVPVSVTPTPFSSPNLPSAGASSSTMAYEEDVSNFHLIMKTNDDDDDDKIMTSHDDKVMTSHDDTSTVTHIQTSETQLQCKSVKQTQTPVKQNPVKHFKRKKWCYEQWKHEQLKQKNEKLKTQNKKLFRIIQILMNNN